jgi:hypothetical protein
MPGHLIEAIPMLVLGLAALAWIFARWLWLRRAVSAATPGTWAEAGRDLAVAIPLAASWFGLWGLYTAYTWTAAPGLSTLQAVRFYVDALGAIALLGAWLLIRVARRATLAAATSAVLVVALFGLGFWSFTMMRTHPFTTMGTAPTGQVCHGHCRQGPAPAARTR